MLVVLVQSAAVTLSVALVLLLAWLASIVWAGGRRERGPRLVGASLAAACLFFVGNSLLLGGRLSGSWPGPFALGLLALLLFLSWGWLAVAAHVLRTGTWFGHGMVGATLGLLWIGEVARPGLLLELQSGAPGWRSGAVGVGLLAGPAAALFLARRQAFGAGPRRAQSQIRRISRLLLAVGLSGMAAAVWQSPLELPPRLTPALVATDFGIMLLVLVAVGATGRATLQYELLSERAPRIGLLAELRRVERAALLIGAICALLEFWIRGAAPASLLPCTLGFALHALSLQEALALRSELLSRLRPLTGGRSFQEERERFASFCRAILGVERACLLPVGTAAGLGVPGLVLEPGAARARDVSPEAIAGLRARFANNEETSEGPMETPWGPMASILMLPGDSDAAGYLLLGPTRSRPSSEARELARTYAGRLLDRLALRQFAHSLSTLYREQILDRKLGETRMRRTLHDEILPELQTLALEHGGSGKGDLALRLANVHRTIADVLRGTVGYDNTLHGRSLRQAIRSLVERSADLRIRLLFLGSERNVKPATADVVYFALREVLENVRRHASECRLLIAVSTGREGLRLEIREWQTRPASATVQATERSSGGAGSGLSIHSAMVTLFGGTLSVLLRAHGRRVVIALPPAAFNEKEG